MLVAVKEVDKGKFSIIEEIKRIESESDHQAEKLFISSNRNILSILVKLPVVISSRPYTII
jgi:hypothetical protein